VCCVWLGGGFILFVLSSKKSNAFNINWLWLFCSTFILQLAIFILH